MKLCSDDFDKVVKFFSNLNIGSNIFYLITGLILLYHKKYFFGVYFTLVSIISSAHHYFNNDLQTCKHVSGYNKFPFLSRLDVVSVNILMCLLLGYLLFVKKPIKIHILILIGICGLIGLSMFFYSETFGNKHVLLKKKLHSININNKNVTRDQKTKLKRKIMYNEILYEAIHGIWHVITGLVGVMIAIYMISS